MEKLKHYIWYDPDDEISTVCLEHPTCEGMNLCGGKIDDTPDGQPEETKKDIDCSFCLEIIKRIREETGIC